MRNINYTPDDHAGQIRQHLENIPQKEKIQEFHEQFEKWNALSLRLCDLTSELRGFEKILDTFVYYDVLQQDHSDTDKLIDTLSQPYYYILREVKNLAREVSDIQLAFDEIEPHFNQSAPAAPESKEV